MVSKMSVSRPNPAEPVEFSPPDGFLPVVKQTHCPFATGARLCEVRTKHGDESLSDYFSRTVHDVISFSERANSEELDALVYQIPTDDVETSLAGLGRLVGTLIRTLLRLDPNGPQQFDRDTILQPEWRLRFAGTDYFMPVFAPLYPHGHSRHIYGLEDKVFMLLQPNESFHRKLGPQPAQVRKSIRGRFDAAGQSYDSDLLEAHKFVLPLESGGPPIPWYDLTTDDSMQARC